MSCDDHRAIHGALVLAGGLPVAGWFVHGGAAGAGITLCFAMIALGVVGLVRGPRGADLPRATLRR